MKQSAAILLVFLGSFLLSACASSDDDGGGGGGADARADGSGAFPDAPLPGPDARPIPDARPASDAPSIPIGDGGFPFPDGGFGTTCANNDACPTVDECCIPIVMICVEGERDMTTGFCAIMF